MKSPQPRSLVVGALALLAVLIAWHWLVPLLMRKPAPKAPPAIAVDVATVERADVPLYLEGLGTVQAFYTVTVNSRVDGQIEKIAFKEGQEVKQGELLAQIDPRPFAAALGVAVATRDKDRAQLENAHRDMERYQLLAPEDLASKQTVDTQQALLAQLSAQIKGDDAAIDNARTQLDYTSIRSPISGRTGIRLVDPGNNVHASDTTGIVVVTQLEPIAVLFSLPEEQFTQLNDALQRGPVTVKALARETRTELDTGTVSADRQPDRPEHRHPPRQGGAAQRASAAVAGPVRHHAGAGADAPAGAHHSGERRAARTGRTVHLRGAAGLHHQGGTLERQRGPGRHRGGRQGARGRAAGRHQQPVPPAARQPHPHQRPRGGQVGRAERRARAVNISRPFIERPVATTLLMAGLALVGLAAFPFLPVAPLPQVDFPTILVSANLPGASPEIMASSVAQPLETQFAQIPGVSQMTSTSVLSSTQITLQFELDRNIDAAAGDVQSAINAAGGQLPKNLPSPPSYRKVQPGGLTDHYPRGALGRAAADRGRRLRRDGDRSSSSRSCRA